MAQNATALIVDDDRAIQRLLADALTKAGFSVLVEKDGEWALKTFEKRPVNVVLLDVLLPAVNGYEVVRKLRLLPKGKRVPIVFLSGVYRAPAQRKDAIEKYNAVDFLEKPIKLAALYDALKRALGDRYPDPEQAAEERARLDAADPGAFADPSAALEVAEVEQAARAQKGLPSLRGNLASKPFAALLAEIYRWRGSGALLLRRDKVKKIVYFRDGQPFFVKSNLLSECLGRVLVREKMISEAECEESLRRMKTSGRQQGTVLIEMGCISPPNLQYALALQLQSKLFDVFGWATGDYQLNARAELPPETVSLEMTCAAVIYEGLKHTAEPERIDAQMKEHQQRYVWPAEDPLYRFQDAGLDHEEQALLNACDGRKTVKTLAALSILPPIETLRLLLAMHHAQMVVFQDAPAQAPERKAAAPWDAGPPPPPSDPAVGESTLVERPAYVPGSDAPEPPTDADADALPGPSIAPPPLPVAKRTGVSEARAPVVARAAGSLLPELSGVFDSASLAVKESVARERLAGAAAAMKRQDYFQILGVPPNAGIEDIKRAYLAKAKEYHPDKHYRSSSAEIRKLANQIYELISRAFETLSDAAERERYVADLAKGLKKDVSDEVSKILAAEGKFQRGEDLLRKKQYKEAHAAFREAVELYGEEGEFHAFLGWSLFQTDPREPAVAQQALDALEKAIRLNPKVDKSYLFLGYIYKAMGRPDKAEQQFEKAIQCNPDCTEALRELRLLGKLKR